MPLFSAFTRPIRGAAPARPVHRRTARLVAAALLSAGLAAPAAAQVQLQIPDQPAPQGQAPQGQAPQGQAPQGQAPIIQAPAGQGPATAPNPSQPQRFGDWVRRCTANPPPEASPPPPGKQEVCFLVQSVVLQNAQKPVLTITIGFFGPEHQSLAIVDTQLRVPLAHGIRVGVDGKEVGDTPFEFCHPQGCRAFLPLSEQIVTAFKAGAQGAVQMRSSGGDPVNLPVSLKGFTAGYSSLE